MNREKTIRGLVPIAAERYGLQHEFVPSTEKRPRGSIHRQQDVASSINAAFSLSCFRFRFLKRSYLARRQELATDSRGKSGVCAQAVRVPSQPARRFVPDAGLLLLHLFINGSTDRCLELDGTWKPYNVRLPDGQTADHTIMALAGHMSRKMMERYSHARNAAKREAVETLNLGGIQGDSPNFPHSKIKNLKLDMPKLLILNGRRGGDRTHNPRLRRPVLYPIELLARAVSL